MDRLKPLIIILGPTASGKTGLALELAKKFDGELINADSRQIYRGMDIATNKILASGGVEIRTMGSETVYIVDGVSLHLLDLIDPDEEFSLADYKEAAVDKIREIHECGKLPILVGGTGLYISSIVDNLEIPPSPPDRELREKLDAHSAIELFSALERIDPESAHSIGIHNKRKLIRSLEVFRTTGQTFSSQRKTGAALFDILQLGIQTDRKELYEKIDARVEQMMCSGLVGETRRLLEKYPASLPAMSGIGYREIASYLGGDIRLDEAIQQIKWHTHQYARRQLTWFKRDGRICWVEGREDAESKVRDFLQS